MTGDLIEAMAGTARDVLRSGSPPYGLRASGRDDGYPEVWTRDTAIRLLGICADGFEEAVPALEASLAALTRAQSTLGYSPLNADPLGQRATANAGGIESNLWYLIAHSALHRTFGVADLLERHGDALARAMLWVHYQDSDDDRLLESQEAADWGDLLAKLRERMGRAAAGLVLDRIEGKRTEIERVVLPTRMVVRRSSDLPAEFRAASA